MKVAGRCRAKNPAGEQCQLPFGHRGKSHEVGRPNERSSWVYRWGRDTDSDDDR